MGLYFSHALLSSRLLAPFLSLLSTACLIFTQLLRRPCGLYHKHACRQNHELKTETEDSSVSTICPLTGLDQKDMITQLNRMMLPKLTLLQLHYGKYQFCKQTFYIMWKLLPCISFLRRHLDRWFSHNSGKCQPWLSLEVQKDSLQ